LLVITFSGFQIVFLGLMGEYLGKQYLDQNNTPQWVIRKKTIH
jgi:polyisoprenyl-phosphate glycosyltransferase